MAEDDEIDILGDYALDNLLSKNDTTMFPEASLVSQNSDLLKCDYTIHPQWLLDKPSTNPAIWYSGTNSDFVPDLTDQSELDCIKHEQVCTENSISDESGWTEKEKNLLNRGSKSPSEVKYFLKNFYSDVQVSYGDLGNEIVFDNNCTEVFITPESKESIDRRNSVLQNEIPTSIEEVIAAVSTAATTVSTNITKVKFHNNETNYNNGHRESLSKKNKNSRIRCKKVVKQQSKFLANRNKIENSLKKSAKFKLKIGNINTGKHIKTNIKRQKKIIKPNRTLKSNLRNINEFANIEKILLPSCKGEEVIKIRKESVQSDSDVEVDVEDCDDNGRTLITQDQRQIKEDVISSTIDTKETQKVTDLKHRRQQQQKIPELSELDDDLVNELMSMEIPKCEYVFAESEITNLEKLFHSEFFEGRQTKTPGRYIKIRNHILNTWKNLKPTYVTKTSIRQGLKQCGDVNCIGRIHQFLEQIGAINFNCGQTSYIRPLYDVIVANYSTCKKKVIKDEIPSSQKLEIYGSRNKKKYIIDGDGGYTLTHNESGDVINATVVNEEPIQKQKNYFKKPVVRLICCRPFENDHPMYRFTEGE